MKKLVPFVRCFTAAALCLSAVSAYAGYITPRVPPAASTLSVPSYAPMGLPAVRTVTTAHDDGPGSLRWAIASAAPGDVVKFALRFPAMIVLTNTLVIDQDLTVLGPGPSELTVMRSGAAHTPAFRVFDVEAGAVTIAGITIRNGSAFSGTNIHDNLGGAILNRGSLTVSNCVITGNSAPTTDWGTNVPDPNFRFSRGFGAGIFSDQYSQLTIINSTVSCNQTGPLGAGGGICTFNLANFFAVGCTVSGNFAGLQGGGVNFQGQTGTMENCTISGNATSDADPTAGGGSGILNVAILNQATPTLTLTACTVAHNTGTTNGAFTVAAFEAPSGITNRLLSTLVADNYGVNFLLYGDVTMLSLGHNLDSDGTSGFVNGANGDLVGTVASPIDARLGPLRANGGPTLTVALLPGSPALGAGACTDANGAPLTVDQRGFPRPQVTGCDIGAFENQAPTLICPVAKTETVLGPHGGAPAILIARVADPDGDALTVIWSVNGVSRQTNHVAGTHPPRSEGVAFRASYPVGTNMVGVVVSDGKAVPVGCSTSVIVRELKRRRVLPIKDSPDEL